MIVPLWERVNGGHGVTTEVAIEGRHSQAPKLDRPSCRPVATATRNSPAYGGVKGQDPKLFCHYAKKPGGLAPAGSQV